MPSAAPVFPKPVVEEFTGPLLGFPYMPAPEAAVQRLALHGAKVWGQGRLLGCGVVRRGAVQCGAVWLSLR